MRYRASKRAEIYIKKMISKNVWKENTPIPSLLFLSKKLKISYPTLLKVIKRFVKNGTINNSFGYYVNSKKLSMLQKNNLSAYYINGAKLNLKIYNMLKNKGKEFSNGWIINVKNSEIEAINKYSRSIINTNFDEVYGVLNNLIQSSDVLNNINLKTKYNRQREIYPVCLIINKFKKEFHYDLY